ATQRLDQSEFHVLRQPADIVMALDLGGGITRNGHGLDHVGVKRALRQEPRLADALCRGLENLDKSSADDEPFALRVGHALEPLEKELRGIFIKQFNAKVPPKN